MVDDTKNEPNNRLNAIIIGSGFGGLATAIRLQTTGKYQVTVVEKLDQIGGRGRVFKKDGFTFDAGPTVITAPFLFEELFKLANRKIENYMELFLIAQQLSLYQRCLDD